MLNILLLDNYDSFTFNLVHYLEKLGVHVDVVRNDQTIGELGLYDGIVLSPGPGLPNDAGNLMQVIERSSGHIPILGVCLGMQAIALHLGGELYNQKVPMHGVQIDVFTTQSTLFTTSNAISVGLYHSWAVEESNNYQVTAIGSNNVVMAIEKKEDGLFGVQFHPESILTANGFQILENFIKFCTSKKIEQ